MRKEIKHKNSNERDKLMTTVTMMMEQIVYSLRKQVAQSVSQSVRQSVSHSAIIVSIKIIQLTCANQSC